MKYYSELTQKAYDTEEECVNAEKLFAEAEAKKKEEANNLSKEKKELAKMVEDAEAELDEAYHIYYEAREEAYKLISDVKDKAADIIDKALSKVKVAERKKYEAVANFNKRFGIYTAQYDGDKALKELRKSTEWINNFFNNFFW